MTQRIKTNTSYIGGISDFDKTANDTQVAFGRNVDMRTDPNALTLLPKTVKETGSVVEDLLKDGERLIGNEVNNASNLLSNSTFESNSTGWGLDADFTRSTSDAYDGTYSIKQDSTSDNANFYSSSGITVTPNTFYRLTFYTKVTVNSGLAPLLEINGVTAFTSSANVLNGQQSLGDTSGAWVQRTFIFNSGTNSSLFIRIFNNSGNVDAFYDLFDMREIGADISYFYDRSGNIYLRSTDGNWSKIRTVNDSHGNGMVYYGEDDYLYYTSDKTIGRYGPTRGQSPSWVDDFLAGLGGNPTNTHSLNLDGSTQYGSKTDSASLSITGDIAMEAFIRPDTLPDVGEAMFVMGKWDENSQRSYGMDLYAVSGVFGDGSDGALTISSNTTQAPVDSGCSGTAGSTSLTATNASFAAGKVILIHQSRGTGAGTYQRTKIASYTAGTITTEDQLNYSYNSSGANKAQVIVVPQYTDITVNSGVTWTAKAWDGTVGGFLVFIANGSVNFNGAASGVGKGFRGGVTPNGDFAYTGCGEGTGGDYDRQIASPDGNGGASEYTGSGTKAGGGGGGNGTAGTNGTSAGPSTGGVGGLAAGNATLTSMVFGGGGSCGGYDGSGGNRYLGEKGGGCVWGYAASLTINSSTGSIDVSGESTSASGGSNVGGGGGGAGGSVLLRCQTAVLGTNRITANGSSGRAGAGSAGAGGPGGAGRIHLDYLNSYSGSTTPTLDVAQDNGLVTTTTYQMRLRLSSTGSNVENLTRNLSLVVSTWTRLSVSWDATTKTASFYQDGTLLGTTTGSLGAIYDSTAAFTVGGHADSGGTFIEFFDGLVDDVRLFNTERTASQISLNKEVELSATEPGLAAYYKFNNAATDATSNANDLTLTGSPTYSTTVPFSNSSTRLDIDQSRDANTNSYTLGTSIDESADTKRLTFVPNRDPQKSIAFELGTKGTGDWTVTIHDAQNNVIATKTVAVGDLPSSGWYEFVFDDIWRPVRGASYHVHVTSTVADGTIVANTSSDFNTGSYKTYYQYLVTDLQYHRGWRIGNKVGFGNERYVAVWDGSSYDPHRITLPANHRVRCFAQWGEYTAIGTWIGNEIDDYDRGRIFFWDGASETYSFFIDVAEGAINAMWGTQEVLYIVAGYRGDILEYRGGRSARKVKRLSKVERDDVVEVLPGAMTIYDTLLRIGFATSTSTTIERGVYTWGRSRDYYEDALTYDYTLSHGSRANADVEVGLVMPVEDKLIIGWRNGTSYGADVVDQAANAFAYGDVEFPVLDDGVPWREKTIYKVRADFDALNSGESVTVKYKKDREDDWHEYAVSTAGETSASIDVNGIRVKEFQHAIELETSSGTSPVVRSVGVQYDDGREERTF